MFEGANHIGPWGFENQDTKLMDSFSFTNRVLYSKNTLETAFGTGWLNAPLFRGRKLAHPAQILWQDINKFLSTKSDLATRMRNFSNPEVIGEIIPPLSFAVNDPIFQNHFSQRLKNPADFEGALFECLIFSKYATDRRHTVEFVLPGGPNQRKPDIKVTENGRSIYVECKKKIIYSLQNFDRSNLKATVEPILQNAQISASFDMVLIILTDYNEIKLQHALIDALVRANNDERVHMFDQKNESGLIIADHGSLKSNYPFEIFIEKKFGNFSCRVAVSFLRGTRLRSVISSLGDARKQLPQNQFGVVALQIMLEKDYKKITSIHMDIFAVAVGQAIEKNFWRGHLNTRIKGIVLLQGPYQREVSEFGLKYTRDALILNPNFKFSELPKDGDRSNIFRVFDNI